MRDESASLKKHNHNDGKLFLTRFTNNNAFYTPVAPVTATRSFH